MCSKLTNEKEDILKNVGNSKASVTLCFLSMQCKTMGTKTVVTNILQNTFLVCVTQKKEMHTGLELHEGIDRIFIWEWIIPLTHLNFTLLLLIFCGVCPYLTGYQVMGSLQ